MKRFMGVKLASALFLVLGSVGILLSERALAAEPRFLFKERTVEDRKTGLFWTRNANLAEGQMSWYDAVEYVKELNRQKFAGYSDWRLPDVEEMRKLTSAAMQVHGAGLSRANGALAMVLEKSGFEGVQAADYWTSTTSLFIETEAWYYSMASGNHAMGSKWLYRYIWPVRWDQRRPYSGSSRDEAKKHGKKNRVTRTGR
jgi:hypothetical protein